MNKIIISTIFFFCCNILSSQNDTLNNYFISYDEMIITSISIEEINDTFYIGYKDHLERYKAELTPNFERKLNFNFTYKIIDFAIGYTPNFLKSNKAQNRSRNFNFAFRLNHKQWSQSFMYLNQRGFYLDLDNTIEHFYFPQFRSTKVGGTTSYIFNKKYSYQTLFNPNEWQSKSTGSFILHFTGYYSKLESEKKEDELNINIYSITTSPSYYYNFVINKKVLIGAGLNLGIGVNIVDNVVDPLIELATNIKIGYNTDTFFSSIGYNGTSLAFENRRENYNNTFNAIKFEIGYRFKPPKKAKKIYEDALNLIPIKL